MNKRISMTTAKISRAVYFSIFVTIVLSIGLVATVYAITAKELDASADAALNRFYKQDKSKLSE